MSGFDNEVLYANNVDFSGGSPVEPKVTTEGQLLIGTGGSPAIDVGVIRSISPSIIVDYDHPDVTLDLSGTGVVEVLTPDSGGDVAPVGNKIPVLGQKANTTATMATYNDGLGNLRIANQVWATQYVVDASSTTGLKGTFTTIQSAIDQAVADGGSGNSVKTIYIRKGTYSENLVMPANSIHLQGLTENGYGNSGSATAFDVAISGQITFTAGGNSWFTNLYIINSGSPVFNISVSTNIVNLTNCTVLASGGANSFTVTASVSQGIKLMNCIVTGDMTLTSSGSSHFFYNSNFISSIALTESSGTFLQSRLGASTISTTTSGQVNFINCSTVGNTLTANASTTIVIMGYVIEISSTFSGAGTFKYTGISGSFTMTSTTQIPSVSSAYNAIKVTIPGAYPYTAKPQDGVILVDTSSARTINLNSGPVTGQQFTIKDNTGSAASNNITITPALGNIDGSVSTTINVNYGSATVVYNATQWNII